MDDQDKQTLRALYEKYGYGGVRGQLDAWDDEEASLKTAPLYSKDN